jgi:3-deoxy-D-manno-octulosonate 8-phosphate phosphatase (KDO 8-P phosphatase)
MAEEKNVKQLLKQIKAMVFDVDGVLTDSSIILMPNGELVRTMNMRDSIAMRLAVKNGYQLCIITGGNSQAVKQRLNRLGISDVYLKTENKLDALKEFVAIYELQLSEVLYMGDDLVDYEPMSKVGLPVCPKDAVQEIKNISLYISPVEGGKGCVREVIEQVMKVSGKWPSIINS